MNTDIINHDPWLYPGCICEVWNGNAISPIKELWYFSGYGIHNETLFRSENSRSCSLLKTFEHYQPIGTPWDYAPKEADSILIYDDKTFSFTDKNNEVIMMYYSFMFTDMPNHTFFPMCYLLPGVYPRPEWTKEKT